MKNKTKSPRVKLSEMPPGKAIAKILGNSGLIILAAVSIIGVHTELTNKDETILELRASDKAVHEKTLDENSKNKMLVHERELQKERLDELNGKLASEEGFLK